MKRAIFIWGMVLVHVWTVPSQAVLVDIELGAYALLSEDLIFTRQSVTINGLIGATGRIRLGKNMQLNGNAYTNDLLTARRNSTITGQIITAEDLRIGFRLEVGSLDSGRDIRIGKKAVVNRDIALQGELKIHPQAIIFGDIFTENDLWNVSLLPDQIGNTFLPPDQLENIIVDKKTTKTLAPGNFAKLNLSPKSTLMLSAGTYFFDEIKFGKKSQLVTDTTAGPVIIHVAHKLRTKRKVAVLTTGEHSTTFSSIDKTRIGPRNTIAANIISYDRMKIAHHSEMDGLYFSENDLRLARKVVINGPTDPEPIVPEPATILLLGLGSLTMIKKRKV